MTQKHKEYLLSRARVFFGMGKGALDETSFHLASAWLQDIVNEFNAAGLPIFAGYVNDYIIDLEKMGPLYKRLQK